MLIDRRLLRRSQNDGSAPSRHGGTGEMQCRSHHATQIKSPEVPRNYSKFLHIDRIRTIRSMGIVKAGLDAFWNGFRLHNRAACWGDRSGRLFYKAQEKSQGRSFVDCF